MTINDFCAVNDWTVDDVSDWLQSIDLSRYINTFQTHMVDGETLLSLTSEELQNDLHINDLRSLHLLRKSIEHHRNTTSKICI